MPIRNRATVSKLLKIRQVEPAAQTVPIEVQSRPAIRTQLRLPLCITWSYRGITVICRPLYSDAGAVVNLTWNCPACYRPQQFTVDDSLSISSRTGRLSVADGLRCSGAGCELHVEIEDGRASDFIDGGW